MKHIIEGGLLISMEREERPNEGRCIFCDSWVYDGREESGYIGDSTDWMTADGDFGCDDSPINSEDGTGGHMTRYDVEGMVIAFESGLGR